MNTVANISYNQAENVSQSACQLKFHVQRGISHFFIPNLYNIIYLFLVHHRWDRLIENRTKLEKKRIANIWKKMLVTRKINSENGVDNAQVESFDGDGDGSTGGLGLSNKQFIKLPKHYEPSLFTRVQ